MITWLDDGWWESSSTTISRNYESDKRLIHVVVEPIIVRKRDEEDSMVYKYNVYGTTFTLDYFENSAAVIDMFYRRYRNS